MDCEDVRDRFSVLWEKELTPSEERIARDHLSSCPQCQREFEQFEKTMQWLHSVGEVEVPDEFLTGLYKKVEERKRIASAEKSRRRWLDFPLPLKLPAQAVAMVAVVFLVLYLAKMMPMEKYRPKEPEQTSSSLSLKEKSEHALAEKEVERKGAALKTSAEVPRPRDVERAKAPVPQRGQVPDEGRAGEASVPQLKAEKKKSEASAQSTEVLGYRAVESKEAARGRVSSSEPGKIERGSVVLERPLVASRPPREIVLKTSNRDKATSQLHELVKQYGGEIVAKEGDRVLASLPAGSLSKFEKELAELSASSRADKAFARKPDTGDLVARQQVMKEEVDKESKEPAPAKLANGEEGRVTVRILLVQE